MRLSSTRRRLKLRGGGLAKMSAERQRLSFFIVVVFLAVFGLIVLAEVLFVEEDGGRLKGAGGDFFYESQWSAGGGGGRGNGGGGLWETPKPLLASDAERRKQQLLLMQQRKQQQASADGNNGDYAGPERLQANLKRHEDEMERLIKNISARIQSSVAAVAAEMKIPFKGNNGAPSGQQQPNLHRYDRSEFDRGTGDAVWQPVNGTKHKFYVYSAYYDPRLPGRRVVRVIGVTKTKNSDRVWCGLSYESGKRKVVPALVNVIRENWNLKFSAAFVLCPLPVPADEAAAAAESELPLQQVPTAVSVFPKKEGLATATNSMPVLNRQQASPAEIRNDSVGVCVKPIHFHYNKTVELIEFIELNRLLGVTDVTLYNDTMSEQVACVLNSYVKKPDAEFSGVSVSVLDWKLNVASQSEIRTEGLFAALNDCLYRNMFRVHYLALIDFDEFIVPRNNRTLPEMLRHVDRLRARGVIATSGSSGLSRLPPIPAPRLEAPKKKDGATAIPAPRVTSSYSFQNAFFYLQFPDDTSEDSKLRTMRKTRRKAKFNPQKQRSKYICVPRNVREAGNHFIWEFADGVNLNVPTTEGFLHHYRVCEFGGDDCVNTPSVVDRTAHRYKEQLVERVDAVAKASECFAEKKRP